MENTLYLIGTIAFLLIFSGCLIGSYIYKKIHHLPTGECGSCKTNMIKAMKRAKKDIKRETACCNK